MARNWPRIFRLASIVTCAAVIIASLFSLVSHLKDFPAGFIINFYIVVFSIMIICAELHFRGMLKYFEFLKTFLGRGLFCIFVSTICFIYPDIGNIIVGIVLALNGGAQVFQVLVRSEAFLDEQKQLKEKGTVDTGLADAVRGQVAKQTKEQMKQQLKDATSSV